MGCISNPSKIINALFSYNVQNEGMNTLHPIPVRLDQEGILRKLDNAINNGKKVIFSGWWYHNGRIDCCGQPFLKHLCLNKITNIYPRYC